MSIATPLSASGRYIVGADGRRIKLCGVNWAGAWLVRSAKGGYNGGMKSPRKPSHDRVAVFHNGEFVYPADVVAADLHNDDLVVLAPRGHPYRLRRISDVHDGNGCPLLPQPGRVHFTAHNGAGSDVHIDRPETDTLSVICHHHDAATRGHIRESIELLDDGTIAADCSCGAEYTAKQCADEYGSLEDAHRRHVAEVAARVH